MADAAGYLIAVPFGYGSTDPGDRVGYVLGSVVTMIVDNTDHTAPTVTLLSPAPNATIALDAAIVLRVEDDRELRAFNAWVEYPDGSTDMVYRNGAFAPGYDSDRSSWVQSTAKLGTLTIAASKGWPLAPTIHVEPVDTGGNRS